MFFVYGRLITCDKANLTL